MNWKLTMSPKRYKLMATQKSLSEIAPRRETAEESLKRMAQLRTKKTEALLLSCIQKTHAVLGLKQRLTNSLNIFNTR